MNNKAFLCFVNAKDFFFENADFNFDHKYLFHVEIDKSQTIYSYKLYVYKRKNIIQPEGFWGKNISAVNVIVGKNGAGKTSFLRFIINNIGSATTAMNGEGVIYIVNHNGTYIVFHNCSDLEVIKSDDSEDANVILEKEYSEKLMNTGNYNPPFDNRRFWRNIIFFSNYFGSIEFLKDDSYLINISKDKAICNIIDEIASLPELSKTTIQMAYQNYRNIKTLTYALDNSFQMVASKSKVSIADLLRVKLLYGMNDYGEFYSKVKEKFPNDRWIGKKRYPLFTSGNILVKESEFEFEAAINKFSVDLMWSLLKDKIISEDFFDTFINELAVTEDKTGIIIAKENLINCNHKDTEKWIRVLNFFEDDTKKFVLYWQSPDEFVFKWGMDDAELVKELVTSNSKDLFFSCDLVGSKTNGYYSSGEESKANFLLSLYDALDTMEISGKEECNNNVILILDEIDAYYHPEYQIRLMSELQDLISKVFKDYNVQIILTSNTPLELSDFPAENIIYLKSGKVCEEQNEIKTFGSNINNLLKNTFYINSSMGVFAKQKIDETIKFLTNQESTDISKSEVKYIISIIGEPIIKDKLQKMYYDKFPEEIPDQNEEVAFYKKQIQEMQKQIANNHTMDSEILDQVEEELFNLSNIIKKIKR